MRESGILLNFAPLSGTGILGNASGRLRLTVFPFDNHAVALGAQNDFVTPLHLDRVEAFGENPQLVLAATAYNPERQWHGADENLLGHRHPPLSAAWYHTACVDKRSLAPTQILPVLSFTEAETGTISPCQHS